MRYWLIYDLGLQGRYDDLFAWLDQHKAKECGDNAATFVSNKSRAEIVKDLGAVLAQTNNARVYIITRKHGGKFILGKRRFAPWTGYAQVAVESGDER